MSTAVASAYGKVVRVEGRAGLYVWTASAARSGPTILQAFGPERRTRARVSQAAGVATGRQWRKLRKQIRRQIKAQSRPAA